MSSLVSKRQQARNEKVLQDLVHNVPGNNFCADCQARNPAWASWSLGVFLCMRCASIHRKLGTHISKVKSLSMDGWSNEQVENMKKVGNVTSNKIYNPQNKKPPVPIDADEADSAMERFIRSKYITSPNGPKSSSANALDEGTPPPLPPKSTSKFSFRSASSILPLSSRSKKEAAMRNTQQPPNRRDFPRSPSPESDMRNKPSKVFGASVQYEGAEEMEKKVASLREMGFTDSQRNATILKGVNGNLERAVETLVRLGEGGDRKSPLPSTSGAGPTLRQSRSLTPVAPNSAPIFQQASFQEQPRTPSTSSSNPFDMLSPAQPQTAQSTGTLQNKNPYYGSNPFGAPAQQQDINQAFNNMSLAPPQPQPLFPNHTGGFSSPQQPMQQQQLAFQQPMAYPMRQQTVPQNPPPMNFQSSMTYPQPQPFQAQQTGSLNPFFANPMQQPALPQQSLSVNTVSGAPLGGGSNPFARSPTRMQSPLGQIPEQTQSNAFYSSPRPLSPSAGNPFFAPQQQQQQHHAPQPAPLAQQPTQFQNPYQTPYQPQQPQQPAYHQYQPQRADKASILALYNQPQLAPQPTGAPNQAQDQQHQTVDAASAQHAPHYQPAPSQPPPQGQQQQLSQQRSVSTPLPTGTNNPFLANGGATAPPPTAAVAPGPATSAPQKPDVSRDSILYSDMSWANGRHSPDAFASLSSRQM